MVTQVVKMPSAEFGCDGDGDDDEFIRGDVT